MAKFKASSIGLDIGSSYIKLVELKKTGSGIVLTKFGIKEIPPDSKSDRDKIAVQLITELLKENNIKPANVNISVGGQSVFVRFVKILQTKKEKLDQMMKFEAQNQIPFPLNEVMWDWSLLNKGISKKAVIVAIKKNLIEEMVSRLKPLKLAVGLIDVSPLCAYNCMCFNEGYNEEKLGAMLDIGAKTANFIIFSKGDVWIRSFPVASEAGAHAIEELAGEAVRSLEYYFMQLGEEGASIEKKLDDFVLTGGGSLSGELEASIGEKFNIKPMILDPFRKLSIPKAIFTSTETRPVKNQLGVAVGLALRGLTQLKIEVNFLNESIREKKSASRKRIYYGLSIGIATMILISFSIFMRQDYYTKKLKLDKINEMTEVYKTYEPKIKRIEENRDILKGKIDILYQNAFSRAIWLDVFNLISEILPEDVWITDVSGVVSIEKSELGRLDLNGKAVSYQSVNNFVSALKSSPSFKEVKPIASSVEKDKETGEEIVKFSITMDVVVTGG